jgi:hypothetical protein
MSDGNRVAPATSILIGKDADLFIRKLRNPRNQAHPLYGGQPRIDVPRSVFRAAVWAGAAVGSFAFWLGFLSLFVVLAFG